MSKKDTESEVEQKLVKAILDKDTDNAYKHLEKIVKSKCAKRIKDILRNT